jgi:hypothetical protein
VNDILYLLEELSSLVDDLNNPYDIETIKQFVEEKRIEYTPTTNAKWEEIK